MVGMILNLIYLGLLIIASPVLLYRAVVHGKYREGWLEKLFGRLPKRKSTGSCIWFHGVSVGEILQVEILLQKLEQQQQDVEIVLTTTTQTAYRVAKKKYPHLQVSYFPFDFTWAVRNAMARMKPTVLCLIELEIWPNLITQASRLDVPVLLINGRMSENSFRGYRRLKSIVSRVLRKIKIIAVQTEQYQKRLIALGANPADVFVTGSIKYDQPPKEQLQEQSNFLMHELGLKKGEPVFVAGSTHQPEEEIAIAAWEEARKSFPALRLVLAPRHAERFEDVAHLVVQKGHFLKRRTDSNKDVSSSDLPVILLDTLGELSAAWGLATIAFVGGSLTKRGGQNMIEPANWGAAVLFGSNTANFQEASDSLIAKNAARVVNDESELASTLIELLNDQSRLQNMGKKAEQFVQSQAGAADRTLALIESVLNDCELASLSKTAVFSNSRCA